MEPAPGLLGYPILPQRLREVKVSRTGQRQYKNKDQSTAARLLSIQFFRTSFFQFRIAENAHSGLLMQFVVSFFISNGGVWFLREKYIYILFFFMNVWGPGCCSQPKQTVKLRSRPLRAVTCRVHRGAEWRRLVVHRCKLGRTASVEAEIQIHR